MNKSGLYKLIFFIIVSAAFMLRVYHVTVNPPSLSWDEVSIGYNAYSILKTGFDEHHRFMPLDAFAAYGDYKPPMAVYLTVPFVALFGLNELAVRLPSVLSGTLTVAFICLLVFEIFAQGVKKAAPDKSGFYPDEKGRYFLALLTSGLLAFSPWHINLSRAGFEANLALCFIVLGTYLIFLARRVPIFWIIAWLPYIFGVYTFNSTRYFIPFLAVFFIIFFISSIRINLKFFVTGLLISTVFLAPIIPHLLSKEARLRFTEVNIFSDSSIVTVANQRMDFEHNSFVSKIIFNRRIGYLRSFLSHYFDNFQPDFLFIKGDGNPKFSTQDVGQLYIIEAPFLIIGITGMFIFYPQIAVFLTYFLLTAVIPAAAARETPHALRILNSIPAWYIFIAFGIYLTLSLIQKLKQDYDSTRIDNFIKSVLNCGIYLGIGIYAIGVVYYLYNYHIHYPREYSNEWQYGYKQAFGVIKNIKSGYDKIYVTDSIGRPYMYALFYDRYNPVDFWKSNSSYFDAAGFYHVDGFDKYVFVKTLPDRTSEKILVIGLPHWVTPNDRVISTISLLNGEPALTVFEKR